MRTVTSRDGTTIAYDQTGQGPPLILVSGALSYRGMDPETARMATFPALTERFSVIFYDRRGRGDSTDTQPSGVEREIEDIATIIDAVGEPAYLVGFSSGAALAFEAALALGPDRVRRLVLYEPPYSDDPAARQAFVTYRQDLAELLDQGRHADAVARFMMFLGLPADQVGVMQQQPVWPAYEAVAPTLAYDIAALGEDGAIPVERAARLEVPTLVLDGGATEWSFLHTTAAALADAIPHAQHRTLEGQTHQVSPEALAPVLISFFQEEA